MARIAQIVGSYRLLALLLALPWAWLAIGYATGRLFYGEVVHASGEWAMRFLLAALAITPLRRIFPRHTSTAWLLPRRRYLGVAAFAYTVLHAVVYLQRIADWPRIVAEAAEAGLLTGWIGLALFLPLAVTSNDASVRRLGPAWKTLHRLVYAAAAASFVHWILVAFDRTTAYAYLAIWVALVVARFAVPARRPTES
ncbi:MAG TPA: ferric reductase-like transmembrane domain-containing protein [Gammaproteobacteria bacterium]|nr:ferric reductase-like transmembrane domain-containing protein [Gammaproteobacteria bacterium]